MADARRVTVYKAEDGWRFRVQASNWRTIDASEEGKTHRAPILTKLRKRYPGVELVIKDV